MQDTIPDGTDHPVQLLFDEALKGEDGFDPFDAPACHDALYERECENVEAVVAFENRNVRRALGIIASDKDFYFGEDARQILFRLQRGMDGYGSRMTQEGRAYFWDQINGLHALIEKHHGPTA